MVNQILWRGDDDYERARVASVWNELTPNRYPEVIVISETTQDVSEAILLANAHGLKVKARSGGHSWTASSLRDNSMLINVGALSSVGIDPQRRTASVGPGARGRALNSALAPHNLFFPTGHAESVGLGGFLLQGGWGWNVAALGPSCFSVLGVEVVLADGSIIYADGETNADVLWAARGSGPGFFGIVTRFDLRLHPRPASMMISEYVYELDEVDDVLTWALEVGPTLTDQVEFAVLGITPRVDNKIVPGPTKVLVSGTALTNSPDDSIVALRPLESYLGIRRARGDGAYRVKDMDGLYGMGSQTEAPGYRYAVDNMWTSVDAAVIVPAVHEMFTSVPTLGSHAALGPWNTLHYPDAALSVVGKIFLQAFTGWLDPADDDRYQYWGRDHMRRLERYADGIQLADENLNNRPEARYLSDAASAKLERLRGTWDPERVFLSYLMGKG